jgi:hypothetical protein
MGNNVFANIFLSNYDGIFTLEDDALLPVDLGLETTITTAYLHSADGVLYAAGPKDIAMTSDGRIWTVVENP